MTGPQGGIERVRRGSPGAGDLHSYVHVRRLAMLIEQLVWRAGKGSGFSLGSFVGSFRFDACDNRFRLSIWLSSMARSSSSPHVYKTRGFQSHQD